MFKELFFFCVLVWAVAGNKSAMRPPLPLPGCGEQWKETGRKLVVWDKGSLTEQQTKGTGTTKIQISGIHRTNCTTHRAVLPERNTAEPSRAMSEFPPPRSLPTGTQHDGTWYGIPGSVWPGWGWVRPPG